jgi:UPF0755 protein
MTGNKQSRHILTDLVIVLVCVGIILALFSIWDYGFRSPASIKGEEVEIYIPPGTGFSGIRKILSREDLVKDDIRFDLLARLMGVEQDLQAGEYRLHKGQPPYQLLQILAKGRTIKRVVTVPEGANIFQVADILAARKLVEPKAFLDLCRDPAFLEELGLKGSSLEGYLFPDTYYFTRGTPQKEIARSMVSRAKEVWDQLQQEIGPFGMTRHQIVTLASIVEKETGVTEERPLIARVFLERLKRGMLLQADPTVIYGRGDFGERLHSKDLKEDQPYNTYVHKGLPPGPIANPGRLALQSVMHPSEEVYLYFVSKNDGTHYFSTRLDEHNRAVRKFQKNGKK